MAALRKRNTIGKSVVEADTGRVVGHAVYSLWRRELRQKVLLIETMAVHPEERGLGLGRMLVDDLARVLARPGENAVMVEVGEQNLEAQLFFQHMGFRAVAVERSFFADGQDGYRMVLQNTEIDRSWVVLSKNEKSV